MGRGSGGGGRSSGGSFGGRSGGSGSFGGGHRGGSRSTGRSSGSSGRSGSSGASWNRNSSRPTAPRPPVGGPGGPGRAYIPPRRSYWSRPYQGSPGPVGTPPVNPGRRNRGCLSGFVTLLVWLVILGAIINIATGGGSRTPSSITRSTVNREKLPANQTIEGDYYRDDLDWISSPKRLESGMKEFYKKTGVAPFLYITDNIGGNHYPSRSAIQAELESMYDELFEDNGHIIILFLEYEGYETWYYCGSAARAVMDDEACEILLDYLDYYYEQDFGTYNDEEYFSISFSKAADKIMRKETTPSQVAMVAVTGIVVIIVIILLIRFWKKRAEAKKAEDERTKQILETPLETFGDKDLEELEKKYTK